MASLPEQINSLTSRVDNLQALLQGARDPGLFYALVGSHCLFGCKVTQGFSATDMLLALDGAASGDGAHLNPDRSSSPVRPEEYSNIANVYGEVFLMPDKNVSTSQDAAFTVATAPGTGYHRYDIVYIYVGVAGPAIAIAAGTPVLNASTPADPTLPQGVLALARVHVEADVTGIADAKITDLRNFTGRLKGEAGSVWRVGSAPPTAGLGKDGDFFLDGPTGDVYLNVFDVYESQCNIRGPQGSAGPPGTAGNQGNPGSIWRVGSAAPDTALGVNGDLYLKSDNGDVYLKVAGLYQVEANIKGPLGNPGTAGPMGTAGPRGIFWRGAWAGGTTYDQYDGVYYNGSSYVSLQAGNIGHTPPAPASAPDAWWDIVAAKGTDGAGAGDVLGPTASIDGNVVLFDGTDGKHIKSTGIGISYFQPASSMAAYAPASALDFMVTNTAAVSHDNAIALFNGTGGKSIKDSNVFLSALATLTAAERLENKRVTPRVGSTTSSATPTIDTDAVDIYKLTAQAADITSFTTNLSGTPTDGQVLIIQITGTAARAIAWGTAFEASTVALPTTTVSTNMLTVGFLYNSVTSKWRCVASC